MISQLTFWFCFGGALLLGFLPKHRGHLAAPLALIFLVAAGLCAGASFIAYPFGESGFVDTVQVDWIPSLGISFSTGVDGISVSLLLMTAVVSIAAALMSWNVEKRRSEFFVHMLILTGAVYGVFVSLDLFLLFVFYEISIIPKYFLIALWGSGKKEYAAMKLVLYSFFGSMVALLALFAVYYAHASITGIATFDLRILLAHSYLLPLHLQFVCFPLFFVGFGILAGLYPFHTWAPTGHVAAPTAASMLLAGVIMKLGAYGCLRLGIGLTPDGMTLPVDFLGLRIESFWSSVFLWMGIAGIVLGAGSSLIQKDLKYVVGYSSVSHMGFVIVGLSLASLYGLSGAILQMISHGFIAALLFACVGRMIYDRTHTRNLEELPAFDLKGKVPLICGIAVVGFIASAGMPGFSGFIAEFTVLRGLVEKSIAGSALLILGVFITFAYSLKVLHLIFWKKTNDPGVSVKKSMSPLSFPEKAGAALLIVAIIVLGILPSIFLNKIDPALKALRTKAPLIMKGETFH